MENCDVDRNLYFHNQGFHHPRGHARPLPWHVTTRWRRSLRGRLKAALVVFRDDVPDERRDA